MMQPDDIREYASSPCMAHQFSEETHPSRPRLQPERELPPYAYVPGRYPHPIRDRDGHSFGAEPPAIGDVSAQTSEFRWGADLFNHGFYWEAHEAWEPLWRAAPLHDPRRMLLKALILLAAAGVKLGGGNKAGLARHATRAAAILRELGVRAPALAIEVGMPLDALSAQAEELPKMLVDAYDPSTKPSALFPIVLSPPPRAS